LTAIMDRIRRGEKVKHFETKRRRKDGKIIDVSITISPIEGHHGVVTGVSTVARDITEQKRLQQEVAKQKENAVTQADTIMQDCDKFLSDILAHADSALEELSTDSSPTDELEKIRNEAIRGTEMVRQSMIRSGQQGEELEVSRVCSTSEINSEQAKSAHPSRPDN